MRVKAPSTLETFLRSFRWGHVRQLDRVSRELLAHALAVRASLSIKRRTRRQTPETPPSAPPVSAPRHADADDAPPAERSVSLRRWGARQGRDGLWVHQPVPVPVRCARCPYPPLRPPRR